MINRCVDGLAAHTPSDGAFYERVGARVARRGYAWAMEKPGVFRRLRRRIRRWLT